MIKLNKTCVMNFENAMRGARNPLSSWDRSDSFTDIDGEFHFGENDLALAKRLCAAGSDHRKFIRQIFVSVDITAPLYWWKEYDTYKIATVANSTSTMHKIHSKPFLREDFSCENMTPESDSQFDLMLQYLESLRLKFNEKHDKQLWYDIIRLLPSCYNQMRTCTLNYENLRGIYISRRDHKLAEWHVLCDWICGLPYAQELILPGGGEAAPEKGTLSIG